MFSYSFRDFSLLLCALLCCFCGRLLVAEIVFLMRLPLIITTKGVSLYFARMGVILCHFKSKLTIYNFFLLVLVFLSFDFLNIKSR